MEPNQPINPYQAPSVDVVSAAPSEAETLIPGGRGVPAGNFLSWIGSGWNIFTQAPLAWVVCTLIVVAISIALSFIPIIGSLVNQILTTVFLGGLMLGCQAQHQGRPLEIGDLFAGFQEKATPLLILGVLYVAATLAVFFLAGILFFVIVGSSGVISAFMSGDKAALASLFAGSLVGLLVVGLVVFLAYIPILMAFLFAPQLVVLQGLTPTEALRMSFSGCLKNFIGFFLCGVVFFIILVIASLPFLLGLLVAIPLLIAATYAAYRDIFLAD